MPTATCTWIEENLGALGQRPLPPHLDGCPRCGARFEELERALREALEPEPVPLSPQLEARFLAAVAARSKRPRRSFLQPVVLGLAGACALYLGVDWLLHRELPNRGAPQVDLGPPKRGCGVPW